MSELTTKQPLQHTAVRPKHSINYQHIDDFLDDMLALIDRPELNYVHFLCSHWRKSATVYSAHEPYMRQFKLFADYEGKTWRVIGCSSMGDIWLTSKYDHDSGYELRVQPNFELFSNWRNYADRSLTWEERVRVAVAYYGLQADLSSGVPKICNRYTSALRKVAVPSTYLDCTLEERDFLRDLSSPPEPKHHYA